MLTLNDGRTELWQWDTGRKLTVDADCTQVHFSNKVFGRSIDVNVVDGVAIIPDVLLQTDKDLNVWAFVGTAENGYTKISKTFKVNRRNKPADYVFTPPDQTSLEEIKEKIEYLESIQDPDAIKNAVDEYLANNPIQIDEKDPTVPDWAKQPVKPKYTAKEVGSVATVNGIAPDENGNVEIEVSGGNADGLTATEKTLILTLFRNAVYTSADMGSVLNQLEALWSGGEVEPDIPDVPDVPDEPVAPEATLSSISATYFGGEVTEGTAVTDLTGIVVTAHYSDGSTATVTDYTLSGTIVEGSNTITVSYGGKTTTFTVNGVAEESQAVNLMTTGDLGTFADLGVYTGYDGYYNADAKTLQLTPKSAGSSVNAHLKITPFVETGKTYTLFLGLENRGTGQLSTSGYVDYSKKADNFETNRLANVTIGSVYQYVQFTVPTDAAEVFMVIVTKERISATVTNVALYEGAYTEMP